MGHLGTAFRCFLLASSLVLSGASVSAAVMSGQAIASSRPKVDSSPLCGYGHKIEVVGVIGGNRPRMRHAHGRAKQLCGDWKYEWKIMDSGIDYTTVEVECVPPIHRARAEADRCRISEQWKERERRRCDDAIAAWRSETDLQNKTLRYNRMPEECKSRVTQRTED